MAPIFFISLLSAHVNARALLGSYGSEPCGSCALPASRKPLLSTPAFPPGSFIRLSSLFPPGRSNICMVSRLCPCGDQQWWDEQNPSDRESTCPDSSPLA